MTYVLLSSSEYIRLLTSALQSKTVKDIYDSFCDQIEDYQEFWEVMEELDNACWVLEPENPPKKATYRKIAVGMQFTYTL